MFKYVGNITDLAHHIISSYCSNFDVAVDETLGNGYDSDFLLAKFKKVYAFDIQEIVIENYKKKNISNLKLVHDSHENIDEYVKEGIDVAMYNLGFLPGGDKNITTMYESTLNSISKTLKLIKSNGLVTIAIYCGHEEGAIEYEKIIDYTKKLPKNQFGVMIHSYLNRDESSPKLIVIEKK